MNTAQIVTALKMQGSTDRAQMFDAIHEVKPVQVERFISDPEYNMFPDDVMHMLADWFEGLYAMVNATGVWVRNERPSKDPVSLGVRADAVPTNPASFVAGQSTAGFTQGETRRLPTDTELEIERRKQRAAQELAESKASAKPTLIQRAFGTPKTIPLSGAVAPVRG